MIFFLLYIITLDEKNVTAIKKDFVTQLIDDEAQT